MPAILYAIWVFLVALGPFLIDLFAVAVQAVAAIWSLVKIASVVAIAVAAFEIMFDPKGRTRIATLIANIVGGAIDKASPLIQTLSPALKIIAKDLRDAVATHGKDITTELGGDFQALASTFLDAQRGAFASLGESTPDNARDAAAEAFKVAFGTGLASHGAAVLFESVFPEKLNTLNGIAPVLGEMAGFKEVAKGVLEPLYKAAFGKSLEYKYNSLFKPEYASEGDAVRWHARRLLSDDDLKEVFGVSGLKAKYEDPYVRSAYAPVSPRAIATAYQDVPFPREHVRKMMEFAGNRDEDIETMLDAFQFRSLSNVRGQYLAALIAAAEHGDLTDAQLDTGLTTLEFSDDARHLVTLTVATTRIRQQNELYRKSVSEAYKFGQVSDADYVSHLEAIGIAQADAEAHYAIDSIAKRGKDALKAERAVEREQAIEQRAAVAAARTEYAAGTFNEAAFAAALLAAGLSAPLIAFATAIAEARRRGSEVLVHGKLVSPADGQALRAQVAAIGEQTVKKGITPAMAIGQLAALEVPGPVREALAAKWAAQAGLGVLQP